MAQEREKSRQRDTESSEVQIINSESELWVEKYKPSSYLDLLSDEVLLRF